MKNELKIWRIAFVMLVAFSLVACSSDDDEFDSSKLAGTWQKIYADGVQDAGIVRYTFFPESSYAGRIELYVSGWPDIEETIDLNYRVGHTGHMNVFTGKVYNGSSKLYGEYDIRKLTGKEMVWYKTDSNEEVARFKKIQ